MDWQLMFGRGQIGWMKSVLMMSGGMMRRICVWRSVMRRSETLWKSVCSGGRRGCWGYGLWLVPGQSLDLGRAIHGSRRWCTECNVRAENILAMKTIFRTYVVPVSLTRLKQALLEFKGTLPCTWLWRRAISGKRKLTSVVVPRTEQVNVLNTGSCT